MFLFQLSYILIRHTCSACGKNFSTKQRLKIHLLTHSGEKPHTCDVCSKSFATESRLRSHRRVHVCRSVLNFLIRFYRWNFNLNLNFFYFVSFFFFFCCASLNSDMFGKKKTTNKIITLKIDW